ncbi:uncharacterized protein [Macrobrachium rosenbergii]|uniref:uncharacterized protein n=1 Tax=Macrobrachium rosenbergii TaxID=79674 RepID=UPI0034D5CAE3
MSPSNSSSSSGGTSNSKKGQTRYKGLFSHQMAPTSRAYLILFSFFCGVLMITTGSVFYHVITMRPMSGMHPMHTPPLPLACTLIVGGILTVLASFGIAWKYGFDDGDDSLEDDLAPFSKEDVLDEQYQSISKEGPPV